MTSSLPPVSIGIPFFNAEDSLLDAVRSVFAQTHQNWELILIDDGSTDRSLELAKSINDPRVKVYSDGENKKLAARLNEISDLAKYDFIARMDADDLMARHRIERELALLCSSVDLDLVSTGVCSLTDGCEPVGVRCIPANHKITPRKLLASQSGIVHASVVARREWLQRNPYREDLAKSQDTNLWVRAYSKDDLRVAIIPEPLYFYREDGNVTEDKLQQAYRIGRITVREDASARFPRSERLRALALSHAKSGVVAALAKVGRLDLIRARRNQSGILPEDSRWVAEEVTAIRETRLPLAR